MTTRTARRTSKTANVNPDTATETETPDTMTATETETETAAEVVTEATDTSAADEAAAIVAETLAADEYRKLFAEAVAAEDEPDTFGLRVAFFNMNPETRAAIAGECMGQAFTSGTGNAARITGLYDAAKMPIDNDPAVTLAYQLAALAAVRAALVESGNGSTVSRAEAIAGRLAADDGTVSKLTAATLAAVRRNGKTGGTGSRNRQITSAENTRTASRDHVAAALAQMVAAGEYNRPTRNGSVSVPVAVGGFVPVADIAGRGAVVTAEGSPYLGGVIESPNAIGNLVTGDRNDSPRSGTFGDGLAWVGRVAPRGVLIVAADEAAEVLATETAAAEPKRAARLAAEAAAAGE